MPTTSKGFPYPGGTDNVDVPGDIQALADAVDLTPGIRSYTSTQIAALAVGDKWAGRVVWNSTTSKLQVSNGSTFSDVDTSVALSSSTPQTLGTAAAGTSSDASRADHRHSMPSASDVGAVANGLVTAKGDVVTATGNATPARLGVGSNDTVLVADSATATGLKWASLTAAQVPTLSSSKVPTLDIVSQSTSYTLALTDAGDLVQMGSASAITLTVPTDASVAFPTGTKIDILQTGAGQVTVAGAGGVTVNATPGLKISAQWGAATLIKRASNTWVLVGSLTA